VGFREIIAFGRSRAGGLACLTTKPKPHRRTRSASTVMKNMRWRTSKRLATTPEKLRAVVRRVVVMVDDVEKELKGK
jgi:hypothetical protein